MVAKNELTIRKMIYEDCDSISSAFRLQNWDKPVEQYETYFQEQLDDNRLVLIAEYGGEFAGYLTILWMSAYKYFWDNNIPEIADLNVLIKYRRRGIATELMAEAESIVAQDYDAVGIGVGLILDYGAAQRLYVKLGYMPDGFGASKHGRYLKYGDEVAADDDLVLCFTKRLNTLR
jgi:ribosomal protein S18 acetylase RimI-like enzyme